MLRRASTTCRVRQARGALSGEPDRTDLPRAAAGHGGRPGGGRRGRSSHQTTTSTTSRRSARQPPRATPRGAVRARRSSTSGRASSSRRSPQTGGEILQQGLSPRSEQTLQAALVKGACRVVTVSEFPEIGRNWWLFLVVGLVSIIAGILAIVYPDITLLALGIFVGVGLLFSGGIEIAEAIAGRQIAGAGRDRRRALDRRRPDLPAAAGGEPARDRGRARHLPRRRRHRPLHPLVLDARGPRAADGARDHRRHPRHPDPVAAGAEPRHARDPVRDLAADPRGVHGVGRVQAARRPARPEPGATVPA